MAHQTEQQARKSFADTQLIVMLWWLWRCSVCSSIVVVIVIVKIILTCGNVVLVVVVILFIIFIVFFSFFLYTELDQCLLVVIYCCGYMRWFFSLFVCLLVSTCIYLFYKLLSAY